jgi:hypothetical protein
LETCPARKDLTVAGHVGSPTYWPPRTISVSLKVMSPSSLPAGEPLFGQVSAEQLTWHSARMGVVSLEPVMAATTAAGSFVPEG